jgi:hypothetical protein
MFIKYYQGNQFTEDEMGGACRTYGEDEKCVRNFGWEVESRRPLGGPRLTRVDNIKIVFKELGFGCVD